MKSKRIKKVLISIAIIFLVLSVSYKIYDSTFEGHQTRDGVFEYNNNVYKRLQWSEGYYIRDDINEKIGDITPGLFEILTGDKWYIYDFHNDEDNTFLAVLTENQYDYFHVCYRSDVVLPELNEENVKSLEIIPKSLDDSEGLFNFDFTMNDVEAISYISDKDSIGKILSDSENDKVLELSEDEFDCKLSKGESYYIIANFNNADEKLCSLVGVLEVEDRVINLKYTRQPYKVDSVFRW